MTAPFYAGQTDYIAKLNELWDNGTAAVTAADASADDAAASAAVSQTKANEAAASAAAASAIVLGVATGHPTARPSLNLDFANSQTVDPRITFTRASTATRTNAKGLIESVASGVPRIDYDPITLACKGLLVEEARTNLLTYTEDIADATWGVPNGAIVGSSTTSPSGTTTAKLLQETATTGFHAISVTPFVFVSGTTYTYSCFVKASGSRNYAILFPFGLFTARAANFTLSGGGSVGSIDAGLTASIVAYPNGWYRCSATSACVSTAGSRVDNLVTDAASSWTYAGSTTSGLYIWGAQLEAGAFPTSYTPSSVTHTGRASNATFIGSNGLVQTAASGAARYSYNPLNLSAAPALLLEAAATNLLVRSQEFDNGTWGKSNLSVSANLITAPDGTTTADKLIENSTASVSHYINQVYVGSNMTVTASAYLKAGERTVCRFFISDMSIGGAEFNVDLVAGTIGAVTNGGDLTNGVASISNAGNGWYRVSLTVNKGTGNTTIAPGLFIYKDGAGTYTGDGTSGIYIWGAQLEVGSYATSYIPTTTATVTRAADTSTSATTTRAADVAMMTGVNFSSWYRQDEGTFAAELFAAPTSAYASRVRAYQSSAGATPNNNIYIDTDSDIVRGVMFSDSTPVAVLNAGVEPSSPFKVAFGYKLNDCGISMNGASVVADTSAAMPVVPCDTLAIGSSGIGLAYQNSHIRRLTYTPKRLTNTELQAITA